MITRSALRDLVRRLIRGYPHFAGFRVADRWGQDLSAEDLPAIGVFTPMERKERAAVGEYTRVTDLQVLIRRQGGASLEDDLDLDAEIMAELLVADLDGDPDLIDCEMVQVETSIPGTGDQRIGGALLTFRAIQFTDEPG